jgi:arylsulfatase A-like enzyme
VIAEALAHSKILPNRREFESLAILKLLLTATVILMAHSAFAQSNSTEKTRYNVLFLAIDDLKPELSCYGAKYIKSPNIDKIANEGLIFERAYCQQALCGPTRASLLSGLRPDSTKIYDLVSPVRKHVANVITLPQYFKNNGYFTASLSKIYHVDDAASWSVPSWYPTKSITGYALKESLDNFITSNGRRYGPITERADVPDNAYADGETAEQAIKVLNIVKDKPFFLAVGFVRPHLPFAAPKKYWDMYDDTKIKVPENILPNNIPSAAQFGVGTGELRQYAGVAKTGKFSREQAVDFIHGYYACVSYMDAQVGKVMAELKRLHLDKNTIVILWGDHGWKLGDYGMWGKRDNMETDVRAPLIISAPSMRAKGSKTNAIVEFVDIYPTLCQAADLPQPAGVQGQSFYSLLNKPNESFKDAAFSQTIRPGGVMGYTMRTDRYRYTQLYKNNLPIAGANELYDHKTDPGEKHNAVNDQSYKATLASVQALFTRYGKNGFNLTPGK